MQQLDLASATREIHGETGVELADHDQRLAMKGHVCAAAEAVCPQEITVTQLLPSNDSTIETPAQTVPTMLEQNLRAGLKLGRCDKSGDGLDVWRRQSGSNDREPLAVRVAMGGDESDQTVSCLGNSKVACAVEVRLLATDVSHGRICLPFGGVPRGRPIVDQEHLVLWILHMVEVVQQLAYPESGIVDAQDHADGGEPNRLGFSMARHLP